MNSRRQALKFCLDAMVVVVIQIEYQFLLEVFHKIEILKIEQFALEQTEEFFDYGIIQTVALSTHALNDTVIRQLSLILFVLVLLFPFRYPIKLDTLCFGGISTSICI